MQIIEVQKDNFTISADPSRLDIEAIADMLTRAYWASNRLRAYTERALQHSLVFGVYQEGKQVGLARVVSDYTTFAWLCDVFIHEEHRGRGLGKWLIQTVMEHPELKDVRRWLLVTNDAHGLYRQFGFETIEDPERWMQNFKPFRQED